ncbi:MAG: DUF1700 domain-containing protein [Defluviitaleaceae bacterium]|nr:DUF1700 domain-containing protein [Defluviitaleaceae bacterium]
MSKAEYLAKLAQKLRVIPENERRDALEYYDGYISDAEDESAAISQLGTPGEVAAIILANHFSGEEKSQSSQSPQSNEAADYTPDASESAFSGMKTALIVILSMFAAPVALPIVVVLAALGFALVMVLVSLIIAFAATAFGLFLGGLASILFFPLLLFRDFGYAVFLLGNGLISVGLGILFVKLTTVVMRGFPKISRYVSKKILGRAGHEKNRMD